MDGNDSGAFETVMTALAETYGHSMSSAMKRMYWSALREYPITDIERAVVMLIRKNKYMPKPSEIREMLNGGSTEEKAEAAWIRVTESLARYGTHRSVDFADKAINAAVRMIGGWCALGRREGNSYHIQARRDFLAAYKRATESQLDDKQYAPLTGYVGEQIAIPVGGQPKLQSGEK